MTASGYEKIQEELKKLINEDRPNIIAAIAEARSHGGLSENAEYQYAKEQQSLIEGKIIKGDTLISRLLALGEKKATIMSALESLSKKMNPNLVRERERERERKRG